MKSTIKAAGAALLLVGGLAQANNVESLTSFESGTPARAADVNSNFQTLLNAINSNSDRIAALEDATDISVAGQTYRVFSINADLGVGDGNNDNNNDFANISGGSLDAEFTFNTDNTGTQTFTADSSFEVNLPSNNITDFSDDDVPFQEAFTYSQSGSSVTVTFNDGDEIHTVEFIVSADGRILMGRVSEEPTATTFGENDDIPGEQAFLELIIAIRQ